MKVSKNTCPSCNKPIDAKVLKELRPFCSKRCKMIDLGGWLSEKYVVPTNEKPPEEKE
jgi:endogenous inhibitor of DNA gyrase (YacG/DUF329 family)